MRLIRIGREKFEFEMGGKEKELLLHVLDLYPLVPETHHRLSRGGQLSNPEENQHLLDEALKVQRLANKKQVLALLSEPNRFVACATGLRVGFTRGETEWLLQVLNDVRIGSWIALGSPGYEEEERHWHDQKSFRHLMAMEIAGGFESYLLQALSGDLPPEHK
jgi:hypothetical protein